MLNVNPAGCARKVIDVHGEEGVRWLERLPALIADCARRWSLTVLPPFEPLSYNYVAPALQRDGTEVVLKAGVPGRELRMELSALRLFDGRGMVRLLESDVDEGVMLLERLVPGTPLSDVTDDEQATHIAVQVMRALWRPVPVGHPFPTIADWAADLNKMRAYFHGGTGPFPAALVDRAQSIFARLLAEMTAPVLIHGDFHHGNILRTNRKNEGEFWLAMDPKGVVGEPLYDAGYFCLQEILEKPQPKQALRRRAQQLAEELTADPALILSWALAICILTGWWSYEDHHGHGYEENLVLAGLLEELLG